MNEEAVDIDTYLAPWHSLAQVVDLTHMSAGEIEAAVHRRELIGIRFNDGQLYFPASQFRAGQVLHGVPQVCAALAAAIDDPETWAVWLTAPYRSSTGPTRLPSMWAALAAGLSDDVVKLAGRDARRWAS